MGLCGSCEYICKNNRKRKIEKAPYKAPYIAINNNDSTSPSDSTITKPPKAYPKGEHFFLKNKIMDNNQSVFENKKMPINKPINDLKKRYQLFFSLKNVINPNNNHSFGISIINNKSIGIQTFLGYLENNMGENIQFNTPIEIDYFFEREQIIIIEPIINDQRIGNIKKLNLPNLISNKNNKLLIENIGNLEINIQQLEKNDLNIKMSCFKFSITLNNSDIFNSENSLNDIFYIIKNYKDGENRRPVYKSKEYNFNLNKLKECSTIKIESDWLCNDNDKPIYFELYSLAINPKESIGYCSFTLNNLDLKSKEDKNEKLEIKTQDNKIIGTLEIIYYIEKKLDITQFLEKDGQINLEIAIDYTESNNNHVPPLHVISEGKKNDYEMAIKSCGDIVAQYDYDKKFPVYGFGGIPKGSKEVNQCFNINFKDDPNIIGIENIINCYKESLDKVKLSGPTNFAHIIQKVIKNIKDVLENKKEENHYYILMILTDGLINDMDETIKYIIEGSKLPLSIIIIGIGNEDFTNMHTLDADDIPLVDLDGNITKRDIVQFVEFNKFKNKNNVVNYGTDLAEEVLKEIPRQLEEYYLLGGKFNE